MKKFLLSVLVIGAFAAVVVPSLAKDVRLPAVGIGADRVVELQRDDQYWEGTWPWTVDSVYNATNLTGVTALGLLEAYQDTKNHAYLNAAVRAADFIMIHLGSHATGLLHYPRLTAPDVVFLHRLSQLTGDPVYSGRATLEWENILVSYPHAVDLDNRFRAINRPSTWDIAFFLEAAYLSNDIEWANDAAEILASTSDDFYYGETGWYALNVGASIRALVDCGYAQDYHGAVVYLLDELVGLSDKDNGIDGWIQDTAYGVLAFRSVGGAGHQYANELARWIARNQDQSGGWIEDGDEYPEIDGEAVRALASTIGKNVAVQGWDIRKNIKSSWRKTVKEGEGKIVKPFDVE